MVHAKSKAVPKICGADIELGNFVVGDPDLVRRYARPSSFSAGGTTTCYEASRRLLREVDGVSAGVRVIDSGSGSDSGHSTSGSLTPDYSGGYTASAYGTGQHATEQYGNGQSGAGQHGAGHHVASSTQSRTASGYNLQDWGRKYLCNGSCIYIDLDHLELATAEVTGAKDHVAAWYAMLGLARTAQVRAQSRMPEGTSLQVLANNSDGYGNAYGSHLSFLMDRQAFSNMFNRKLHYLMFLASYQASSIAFSGAGKAGSENGRPEVDFQIAQRADFFETLSGAQTTYFRPLVNARDEALCGTGRWSNDEGLAATRYARLHVIFYDNTLNQVASFLKVGVMQIMLTLIENSVVDLGLVLEDPVRAVHNWSPDPSLTATAPTIQGVDLTATEHQRLLFNQAEQFAATGGLDGVVPEWQLVLEWWGRVLDELAAYDLEALSRHVDWALKFRILEQVRQERNLPWDAPEIKHLDQIYSSLDPDTGLFWAYEKAGLVDRIVTAEHIAQFTTDPPEDTRAWGRGMLLRRAEPHQISRVDWDQIDFQSLSTGNYWSQRLRFDLNDPTRFTRSDLEGIFEREEALPDLLDAIEETISTNCSTEGD